MTEPHVTNIDKEAASRLQSETARQHGGIIPKDSVAALAQSVADKTELNPGINPNAGPVIQDKDVLEIDKETASKIQSETARQHGGQIPKDSYAALAQSVADKKASIGISEQDVKAATNLPRNA